MSREQFAADVLAAIDRHYPLAQSGDQDQIAECTTTLAVSLSGMLAYVVRFSGEAFLDEWEELLLAIIRKEATEILDKAAAQTVDRRH